MSSALFPAAPPTHAELVERAVRWLQGTHKCRTVFAEFTTASHSIPDAIGWRMSWSVLVECKVSRSDFAADRKKLIHLVPDSQPGQERWYLTPPGLIGPGEVPDGWGLAEAHPTSVRVVLRPARRFDTGPRIADRSAAELPLLLSALRRHELGVPFDAARGRFETIAERERRGA